MGKNFTVKQVGRVRARGDGFQIELEEPYKKALTGLEGFEYIQVLWWFSGCDDSAARAVLTVQKPYTRGPELLGAFATRSPMRPNPLALSCARVTYLDLERGVVGVVYLDAEDGSPVLDIKPYTPSLDRVERPGVPDWCAHWPRAVEDGGGFPWEEEFNF